MIKLCTEVGYYSINHVGEELCGDHVEVIETDDSQTIVLADGLGSGVKANILAILTSKIISTMIANDMPIEECVKTIAQTLPVCEVRKVAYSTFTIIRINHNQEAIIIEYDNPLTILLRDGKNFEFARNEMIIENKRIYQSRIQLQINDCFLTMSDGAIYAGVGQTLNFGWQRPNIIEYMEKRYDESYSAKTLSTILLDKCNQLYNSMPGDDTTVCCVKIRERKQVNLLVGPPSNKEDDNRMLTLFFGKEGKHIVCGGTTSQIVSKFLRRPIDLSIDYVDLGIPPTAKIEGVDLVTEGVITLAKVLEYANSYLVDNDKYMEWSYQPDGASSISRLLFEEATDINFFVGRAVNPAHQNPSLPINFNVKMRLVDELTIALKKMGKRIKVSYF